MSRGQKSGVGGQKGQARAGSWKLEAGSRKETSFRFQPPASSLQPRTVGLFRKAQATLEMCIALLGVMLLLFGALKMFLWITSGYVIRQRNYERTRVDAASRIPTMLPRDIPKPDVVKWQEPPALDIFNEKRQ